jgi:hypothetical protein
MLPDDDLIPIPAAADDVSAAAPSHEGIAALNGVEIVELITDFGADGTSVDLGPLFESDARESDAAEPALLDGASESSPAEGFAISLPAGVAIAGDGSFDGGVM